MVLAMLAGVMPISAGAEEALDAAAVQEVSTEPPATSEAAEETQPQVAVETQPSASAGSDQQDMSTAYRTIAGSYSESECLVECTKPPVHKAKPGA